MEFVEGVVMIQQIMHLEKKKRGFFVENVAVF